ncbi:MAG: methyltransferase domain-containing protein [Pseudomonadota bacterium]
MSLSLWLALAVTLVAIIVFLHWYSYGHLKSQIAASRRWDLNICCGNVDGGGVNADIVRHNDLPNFVCLSNIYSLPFADKEFETVLCSHTAEHVDDPDRFDRELRRVGREVVYVLPPLWDLAACFNVLEHRWIFLSIRKLHYRLPRRVPLPFARRIQARLGQKIAA